MTMTKETSHAQHPAHGHHTKAAEHHDQAMKHHKEAATHYAAGQHEKAAHHAHTAHAHSLQASHHANEAAKAHVSHGQKEECVVEILLRWPSLSRSPKNCADAATVVDYERRIPTG